MFDFCRLSFLASVGFATALCAAEPEWPQWHGPNRDQVWAVRLPETLLKEIAPVWRKPLGGGFGGAAVADGRVFVMDRQKSPKEVERVVCMDLDKGTPNWVREYPVKYGKLD